MANNQTQSKQMTPGELAAHLGNVVPRGTREQAVAGGILDGNYGIYALNIEEYRDELFKEQEKLDTQVFDLRKASAISKNLAGREAVRGLYQSYSGGDIRAMVNIAGTPHTLGSLLTVSYSIHREKVPVRRLGQKAPTTYTRGTRCLPASERVLIKNRGLIPINQVYVGDEVQSEAGSYNCVMGVYNQGSKDCYYLELANGYTLKASYDHPISTPDGWIEMKDLKPGMIVDVVGYSPVSDIDYIISDDILKLIAYLLGDGTTRIYQKSNGSHEYRIGLSISDKEMDTIGIEVAEILNRLNIPFRDSRSRDDRCINRIISTCCQGAAKTDWRKREYNILHWWLCKFDMYNKYSYQKEVPSSLLASLSKRQIAIFLSRLFSTDGHYSISSNFKYIEAGYCSTSELLIDGIRLMLNKLGINCIKNIEYKIGKLGGKNNIVSRHNAHHLKISDTLELLRFIKQVGIFSKDYIIQENNIQSLLKTRIKYHTLKLSMHNFNVLVSKAIENTNINKSKLFNQFNLWNNRISLTPRRALQVCDIVKNDELTNYIHTLIEELIDSKNDYQAIPVIRNTFIGPLQVYDLEVENRHTFIANFIKVHNTIAGSLVFLTLNKHVLLELNGWSSDLDRYSSTLSTATGSQLGDIFNNGGPVSPKDMMESFVGATITADILPPFDIILNFHNEFGVNTYMAILGVQIVDEGQTFSIDDIVSENTFTYTAIDVIPMVSTTYSARPD